MLSAQKWLWIQRIRPWGWRERQRPLLHHLSVACDPAVGWFVPTFHLPRGGCSTVPSPAFHGGTQLCRGKRSIPEHVRWDRGGCGFVVCVGTFFWLGKGLFNMVLAKFLSSNSNFAGSKCCWNQWVFFCVSWFRNVCVSGMSTSLYWWISLQVWCCSLSLTLATLMAFLRVKRVKICCSIKRSHYPHLGQDRRFCKKLCCQWLS